MTRSSFARRATARVLAACSDLFVTLCVLTVLFGFWLVFYTDFQAEGRQDSIISSQSQQWGTVPDRVAPERRTDIPVVSPPKKVGEIWAVAHVPRFERPSAPIATGIDRERVLNRLGLGWYPETVGPGGLGNFSLAGHRTTYGKPLVDIAELKPGDPIVIETKDYFFVYRAGDHKIVSPDASEVIAPVPGDASFSQTPNKRMLTLTACHPKYSLAERYIVHAELDYYTRRGDGVPPALAGTGILQGEVLMNGEAR